MVKNVVFCKVNQIKYFQTLKKIKNLKILHKHPTKHFRKYDIYYNLWI